MCGFFDRTLGILSTYGYEFLIVPVFEKVCLDEVPIVLQFLSAFYFGVFYRSCFFEGKNGIWKKKKKSVLMCV